MRNQSKLMIYLNSPTNIGVIVLYTFYIINFSFNKLGFSYIFMKNKKILLNILQTSIIKMI